MLKWAWIAVGIMSVSLWGLLLRHSACQQRFQQYVCLLPRIQALPLQSGDLIFTQGSSWQSDCVRWWGASAYSHVGVVWVQHDRVLVLHATPEMPDHPQGGVICSPLAAFIDPAENLGWSLYRVTGANRVSREMLEPCLESYAEARLPFDAQFSLANDQALYCTELVWKLFQEAGLTLLEESIDSGVLMPHCLMQSPYLQSHFHCQY